MNYPVWDVPFGSQWLIAAVAVVHVFIAHFAIGGGLFMVLLERRAHRHDDRQLALWLKSHSRFFLLLTLVSGALTGVGIWFTVGLVSPEATSSLIHTFVWAWAIEWVFFIVEIFALLVYYYTWGLVDPHTHRLVGWIYFAAAYMSLVVINGILTFQLTPGNWIATGSFWSGFLNPGALPSLALRSLIALMLAGVYALLTASFTGEELLKEEIVSFASHWVWVPSLLVPPAAIWYFHTVPQAHRGIFHLNRFVQHFTWLAAASCAALALLSLSLAYLKPFRLNRAVALTAMVLAFCLFGSLEWIREDLRKPYLINGYVYANQIPLRQEAHIKKEGLLASALFVSDKVVTPENRVKLGGEIFRISCGLCHRPFRGFNALAPKFAGLEETYAVKLVKSPEIMRGGMPPFLGTTEEAATLAAYLYSRGQVPAKSDAPAEIWRRRCGWCHTIAGEMHPLVENIHGMTVPEIEEMVKNLDSIGDTMPEWTGSEEELKALSSYIGKEAAASYAKVQEPPEAPEKKK